jgi:hypothetical protein
VVQVAVQVKQILVNNLKDLEQVILLLLVHLKEIMVVVLLFQQVAQVTLVAEAEAEQELQVVMLVVDL